MQQKYPFKCLTYFNRNDMEHQPDLPPYLDKVANLNQAVFYCYNEGNEKLPVSISTGFTFKDNDTLQFSTQYVPLTEQGWNVYAAELYFFRKGIPYSLTLHGVAVISSGQPAMIEFRIQDATYFSQHEAYQEKGFLQALFKPTINLYKKGTELLYHAFRRKGASLGMNKLSANA